MVALHVQLTNSTLRRVIKRLHFPLEVMLVCVRWYAAYALSLRNLEEMIAERGVQVDHATVHRWALKMLPVLAGVFMPRKLPVGASWRVDETYVPVGGQWKYLYRAVDKLGQTVDFVLGAQRDVASARRFFERAIDLHDVAEKITIDKSGANTAAVRGLIADSGAAIELRHSRYLNNVVEQDLATGKFDCITFIHSETSTGTLSPIADIMAVVREFPGAGPLEERPPPEDAGDRVELGQCTLCVAGLTQRGGAIEAGGRILRIDRQHGVDLREGVIPALLGKGLLCKRLRALLGREPAVLRRQRMVRLRLREAGGEPHEVRGRGRTRVHVDGNCDLLRQAGARRRERVEVEQDPAVQHAVRVREVRAFPSRFASATLRTSPTATVLPYRQHRERLITCPSPAPPST